MKAETRPLQAEKMDEVLALVDAGALTDAGRRRSRAARAWRSDKKLYLALGAVGAFLLALRLVMRSRAASDFIVHKIVQPYHRAVGWLCGFVPFFCGRAVLGRAGFVLHLVCGPHSVAAGTWARTAAGSAVEACAGRRAGGTERLHGLYAAVGPYLLRGNV